MFNDVIKMAVSIYRKDLINDYSKNIVSDLTIIPTDVNERPGQPQVKKIPIYCYKTSDEYGETDDLKCVNVPFNYGHKFAHDNNFKLVPKQPLNVSMSYKFHGELRSYQVDLMKDAKQHLDDYRSCTLFLHPGAGKTVLGAWLGSYTETRTIIIIHRDNLVIQWVKTFSNLTDAKIFVMGDVKKGTVDNIDEANVVICMNQRISKIDRESLLDLQTVIVDEAHSFCSPTRIIELLQLKPRFLILATATPDKLNGTGSILTLLAGDHMVYKPYRGNFEVKIVHTGIAPIRRQTEQGRLNWTIFIQSLYYCSERNEKIINIINMFPKKDDKFIILTSEYNHVMLLTYLLRSLGHKVTTMAHTDKAHDNSKILIGTISKIGTGYDEANFNSNFDGTPRRLMIMVAEYKDPNLLEQCVGRVLRAEEPLVYYFKDNDNMSDSHCKIFKDWVTKSGGKLSAVKIGKDIKLEAEFIDKDDIKELVKNMKNNCIKMMKDDVGSSSKVSKIKLKLVS